MKIDRSRPEHWLRLLLFSLNVGIALCLRPFTRRRGQRHLVVIYGHQLNGNLLALVEALKTMSPGSPELVFVTMDSSLRPRLEASGVRYCAATHPECIQILLRASAVVSDHGLHAMQPLVRLSSIRFFDVWHGIPFKGWDERDFRALHRYDEIWVPSELMARVYVQRFGFCRRRVITTGYARTDRLVDGRAVESAAVLRKELRIRAQQRVVLIAPTWAQDSAGRSIFPFNATEDQFLGLLRRLGERHGARILLRTHLNTSARAEVDGTILTHLPAREYPDTEAILALADVLVTDWSSIAFDFLLLDRPAVFLEVPAPFRKGFTLSPIWRYGPVISDLPGLEAVLQAELSGSSRDHEGTWARARAARRRRLYAGSADGRSARRCADRLVRGLES